MMDPRKKLMLTFKSNLSFRCQESASCSNTQPHVVPTKTGKMYMMQSVQTDIVKATPVCHAQTNTSPVPNMSTCIQTKISTNHTSSQTHSIKIKDTRYTIHVQRM